LPTTDHAHAGHQRAVGRRQHGIELHLGHPRQRADERRHLQQQPHHRFARLPGDGAVGVTLAMHAVDQVAGEPSIDRRQHQHALAPGHRAATAGPEGDHGPERGVGVHAERELASRVDAGLLADDETDAPVAAIALSREFLQVAERARERAAVAQVLAPRRERRTWWQRGRVDFERHGIAHASRHQLRLGELADGRRR